MNYASTFEVESAAMPGVRYRLRRISFGRRLELARSIRDKLELMDRAQLLPAGEVRDAETALLAAEVDAAHLRWGLEAIEGLEIDGAPATADSLLAAGPEPLLAEILAAIRHETGLDEEERKNSAPPSISCAGEGPARAMHGSAEPVSVPAFTAAETAAVSSPTSTARRSAGSFGDGGIPATLPIACSSTSVR